MGPTIHTCNNPNCEHGEYLEKNNNTLKYGAGVWVEVDGTICRLFWAGYGSAFIPVPHSKHEHPWLTNNNGKPLKVPKEQVDENGYTFQVYNDQHEPRWLLEPWDVFPLGPQPKMKRHVLLADAMYCQGCQPDLPKGDWKVMFGLENPQVTEEEQCDKWKACDLKKGHKGHKNKKYPRKRKREDATPAPAAAPPPPPVAVTEDATPVLDQGRDVLLDALKEAPVPKKQKKDPPILQEKDS